VVCCSAYSPVSTRVSNFDQTAWQPVLQPLGGETSRASASHDQGSRITVEPAVMAAFSAQRKIFESWNASSKKRNLICGTQMNVSWPGVTGLLNFNSVRRSTLTPIKLTRTALARGEGRKLTGPYLSRMEAKRTALYQRIRRFMDEYEFLILPVNQVLPFDVNVRYPTEISGVKMENYIAWMKSTYYISIVGNPALSVPCAFSETGLPIGIQIVGRHNDDWGVLQLATLRASDKYWRKTPRSCVARVRLHLERETAGALRAISVQYPPVKVRQAHWENTRRKKWRERDNQCAS